MVNNPKYNNNNVIKETIVDGNNTEREHDKLIISQEIEVEFDDDILKETLSKFYDTKDKLIELFISSRFDDIATYKYLITKEKKNAINYLKENYSAEKDYIYLFDL